MLEANLTTLAEQLTVMDYFFYGRKQFSEEEMVFIDLGFLIFLYNPSCVLSFILFFTLVQQYPILPCFSFKRLACLPASLSALNPCERHHLPL